MIPETNYSKIGRENLYPNPIRHVQVTSGACVLLVSAIAMLVIFTQCHDLSKICSFLTREGFPFTVSLSPLAGISLTTFIISSVILNKQVKKMEEVSKDETLKVTPKKLDEDEKTNEKTPLMSSSSNTSTAAESEATISSPKEVKIPQYVEPKEIEIPDFNGILDIPDYEPEKAEEPEEVEPEIPKHVVTPKDVSHDRVEISETNYVETLAKAPKLKFLPLPLKTRKDPVQENEHKEGETNEIATPLMSPPNTSTATESEASISSSKENNQSEEKKVSLAEEGTIQDTSTQNTSLIPSKEELTADTKEPIKDSKEDTQNSALLTEKNEPKVDVEQKPVIVEKKEKDSSAPLIPRPLPPVPKEEDFLNHLIQSQMANVKKVLFGLIYADYMYTNKKPINKKDIDTFVERAIRTSANNEKMEKASALPQNLLKILNDLNDNLNFLQEWMTEGMKLPHFALELALRTKGYAYKPDDFKDLGKSADEELKTNKIKKSELPKKRSIAMLQKLQNVFMSLGFSESDNEMDGMAQSLSHFFTICKDLVEKQNNEDLIKELNSCFQKLTATKTSSEIAPIILQIYELFINEIPSKNWTELEQLIKNVGLNEQQLVASMLKTLTPAIKGIKRLNLTDAGISQSLKIELQNQLGEYMGSLAHKGLNFLIEKGTADKIKKFEKLPELIFFQLKKVVNFPPKALIKEERREQTNQLEKTLKNLISLLLEPIIHGVIVKSNDHDLRKVVISMTEVLKPQIPKTLSKIQEEKNDALKVLEEETTTLSQQAYDSFFRTENTKTT